MVIDNNCHASLCSFRGIITGVYTTNSVDSTLYVLEQSGATIVVVDDAKQMEKVREIKKKMPHLKIVIQTREPFAESNEGFYRWDELESMDTSDVEEEYQHRLSEICANDCCSLIFTSGTTGRPKVCCERFSLLELRFAYALHSMSILGSDVESRQSHVRSEDGL